MQLDIQYAFRRLFAGKYGELCTGHWIDFTCQRDESPETCTKTVDLEAVNFIPINVGR
jgi:hypothetical protein